MTRMTNKLIICAAAGLVSGLALAQESAGPGFGGPNAVENQVGYDFGDTWDDWKQKLKDDLGLVLSVDWPPIWRLSLGFPQMLGPI